MRAAGRTHRRIRNWNRPLALAVGRGSWVVGVGVGVGVEGFARFERRRAHNIRLSDRTRRRLPDARRVDQAHSGKGVPLHRCRRCRARVNHVGSEAEVRADVEADARRVLLQQAVLFLPAEAVRVAVVVQRLPPRVGLEVEVKVVLVHGRVLEEVAVVERCPENVVANHEPSARVLEASGEPFVELDDKSRPGVAAGRAECCEAEEEPGAAWLRKLTGLKSGVGRPSRLLA